MGSFYNSDTFPNRHVLSQMHTRRQYQERETRQVRGAVYEAVRG